MDDVAEKVIDIIVRFLSPDEPEVVTFGSHLRNDLGADSLDAVEIVMALEEEFRIEISDEEAEEWETVGQIIEFVRSRQ